MTAKVTKPRISRVSRSHTPVTKPTKVRVSGKPVCNNNRGVAIGYRCHLTKGHAGGHRFSKRP